MKELWSRCERMFAWFLATFLVVSQLLWVTAPGIVYAASPSIVISQLQVAGPSAADEFIELYNPTNNTVAIDGWSVQYRGGAASSFDKINIPAGKSIPSHGYYLLGNANGSFATQANQTYSNSTVSLSAIGATVFLVNNQTLLTTGNDGSIMDKVAYGTGTLFPEGSPFVPSPALNMSIGRTIVNSAVVDTDNNAADFTILSPSNAHGTTILPLPLGVPVLTLSPDNGQIIATWPVVTTATGYGINISNNGNTFSQPDEVLSSTTLSKTFTGLTNGTTYTVRLRALRSGDVSNYASKTTTPAAPVIVAPTPVQASIAYFATGATSPATSFGATNVRAEVTFTPNLVVNPSLTLARPNTTPLTLPLSFDVAKNMWKTQSDFAVTKSTGNQDGNVLASLSDANTAFSITAGTMFSVDTTVTKPLVTSQSVCNPNQDSFTATVDNDVTNVYLYRAASADTANLLTIAQPNQGKVGPVFLGNNLIGTFYVVAQDLLGNRSEIVAATNDIVPPTQPSLQVEAKDKSLHATWNGVSDATNYFLHWKKMGTDSIEERVLGSNVTSYDIPVPNDTEYLVSLAAGDTACNISTFAEIKSTAHAISALANGPKGGNAELSSEREASILASVRQQFVQASISKDGEPVKLSPYSVEEDRDQNGIKDSEEDKNGNGIKDGEEKNQPTPSPEENQGQTSKVKDRSRLILGIAILLIIAGAAIAAYSWYQGDRTPPSGPTSNHDETPAAAPAETETKKTDTPKGGNKGGKKRKTRW